MKVFIAHTKNEAGLAGRIADKLCGRGHTVFFDEDEHSLPPGQTFDDLIRDAIEACDLFVFLISPQSVAPGCFALTELKLAKKRWRNPTGHVLAVMAAETPISAIPSYLRTITTILRPEGDAAAEILATIEDLPGDKRDKASVTASGRNSNMWPRSTVLATNVVATILGLGVGVVAAAVRQTDPTVLPPRVSPSCTQVQRSTDASPRTPEPCAPPPGEPQSYNLQSTTKPALASTHFLLPEPACPRTFYERFDNRSPSWTTTSGRETDHEFSRGRASLGFEPFRSGESWISADIELYQGNQLSTPMPIGRSDFEIKFEIQWSQWTKAARGYGGVGLTDDKNRVLVFLGYIDDDSDGTGSPWFGVRTTKHADGILAPPSANSPNHAKYVPVTIKAQDGSLRLISEYWNTSQKIEFKDSIANVALISGRPRGASSQNIRLRKLSVRYWPKACPIR